MSILEKLAVPGSYSRIDPPALGGRIGSFAALAGWFGVGVGSIVLLGWLLDLPSLKSILPGLALMQPNTALSVALAGLAILGLKRGGFGGRTRRISSGLAGLSTAIGLLTLAEYASGVDLGIDLLLFGRVPGSEGPPSPGRMSFMTATCIASMGSALLLLDAKVHPLRQASQAFALLTTLLALLDLIGYAYGVRFLYMVSAYSTMALHTATTLFVLGIGILAARPGTGLMRRFLAEDAGGWLLRNLLPLTIALPLLSGGLRVAGEAWGLFNPRFGSAVLVLGNIVTLIGLLWWTAGRLSHLDGERGRAELALVEREAWLRTTLTSIGDAVMATDAGGRVSFMNPVAEAMTGWMQADASGQLLGDVFRIVNETTRNPAENPAFRALREGVIVGLANHTVLISRDGTERAIDDSAAPIRDGDRIIGAVLVFRDMAEKRKAERELEDRERQFRTLADSIPQLAWMAEPDGDIFWYNRRWYDYTGTTIDQMGGWGWSSVHDPEELPRVLDRWKVSIATGEPFDMVFPLKGRDGEFRPFLTRVMPIKDDEGRVSRWFGTNTDITEVKRAEEDRQKFVSLAENSTDFIGMCDLDGLPSYLNRSGMNMVGLDDLEQARRIPIHDYFFPEDRPRIVGEFIPSVLERGHGEIEVRFHHFQTGDAIWVTYKLFALTDAQGVRVGLATVSRDITQRRRNEEDLRSLSADLSEADHRKDEFLATLAHELRNPLAPIRNGLQIMKMAGDDGKAVDDSRSLMERQVTHMVRLIDDLMDVSRITRNKLELRRERVDLATIVRNAVETSRPLVEDASHELSVTLPARPMLMDADVTRLSQVFSNLLNNAAKYTERGGDIALVAERQGSDVVVTVRDNGVGIPPEMLPRLFDMFTQVDRSLERSQGGLGIGLSLVKTLVEMHGGSVEARSGGHGQGSEFVVRLPVVLDASSSTAAPGAGRPTDGPTKPLRILVVDDNVDSARTLARLLKLLGHETRMAHDGGEAVEVAEQYRPELLLLDIGLPVMNGYEVAREIRGRDWGRGVAIVALTGWGQEDDRRRSKEAGIDDHLVKPVDPATLESLLAGFRPEADSSSISAKS